MDWGPEQRNWFFKRTKTYKNWLPQSDSNQEQIHKMTNQIYKDPSDPIIGYFLWTIKGATKQNKIDIEVICYHYTKVYHEIGVAKYFAHSFIKHDHKQDVLYLLVSATPGLLKIFVTHVNEVTGLELLPPDMDKK